MKKKYLVSVPILCKAEIYIDAETEEEAMELAMLEASENKEYINHETVEPLYYENTLEEMQTELLDFATNNGYEVFDCKKEFGEDF